MADFTNRNIVAGYSPIDEILRADTGTLGQGNASWTSRQGFGGSDYTIWFNNKQVANLESMTLSTTREMVGDHSFGSADASSYIKGKRVHVGSMTMRQKDRDALLYEVFEFHTRADTTQMDLLSPTSPARLNVSYTSGTSISTTASALAYNPDDTAQNTSDRWQDIVNSSVLRGATPELLQTRQDKIRKSIDILKKLKVKYVDQLPPFDATIVGINEQGLMAFMTIYGISINQKTMGISMQDMTMPVAMSFTALAIEPWTPVQDINNIRV